MENTEMNAITANALRKNADLFNNKGKIEEIENTLYRVAAKGGYDYGCKIENEHTEVESIIKHFQDNGFKVTCDKQKVGYYLTFQW